jgi:hypothetical protein
MAPPSHEQPRLSLSMNRRYRQLAICTKCRSWRVTEEETENEGAQYRCQECAHEWSVSREEILRQIESEKNRKD